MYPALMQHKHSFTRLAQILCLFSGPQIWIHQGEAEGEPQELVQEVYPWAGQSVLPKAGTRRQNVRRALFLAPDGSWTMRMLEVG